MARKNPKELAVYSVLLVISALFTLSRCFSDAVLMGHSTVLARAYPRHVSLVPGYISVAILLLLGIAELVASVWLLRRLKAMSRGMKSTQPS